MECPVSGDARRPAYARVLRLRYLHPGGVLCFAFFEGMILLAVLLALAELVTWWVVIILPLSVGLMVKVNDVIAGLSVRQPGQKSVLPRRAPAVARGSAAVEPQVRSVAPQRTNPAIERIAGGRPTDERATGGGATGGGAAGGGAAGGGDNGRAVGTAPAPGGPGGMWPPTTPGAVPGGPYGTGGPTGPVEPVAPAAAGEPAGGLAGELDPKLPLRRTIRPNQRRFERPL
jgi:hypothetical protein